MTKLANVERERAIGMLKANLTPLIVAKRFPCHVRMIGRLKNHLQQIGTTSHRPRPGHRRVSTRRQDRATQTSYLCNGFYLESVTARTPKELIIQKSGHKLREIISRDMSKAPTFQRLTELNFGAVFKSN